MASPDAIRQTVLFAGQVQGVGFRYTTRDVASSFDVTGYVRNLPDGQVELVAEGPAGQVRAFIEAVESRMAGFIRQSRQTTGPATAEFDGFGIRH